MNNMIPSGDNGILIELGNDISENTNRKVRDVFDAISAKKPDEILELIPAYTTILVLYNPLLTTYSRLVAKLGELAAEAGKFTLPAAKVIHIPVMYGGEYGIDIGFVAEYNKISEAEVIQIHSGTCYLVYMLGFTPGFPYLGGMSMRIAAPRLETPREKIPSGSVGIAGSQTGIYPMESPGGWRIIGRTPIRLFNPANEPSVLLRAGNYLKFEPISQEEYIYMESMVEAGDYKHKTTEFEDINGL